MSSKIRLTIVYGKSDQKLDDLREKLIELGLEEYVSFVDFVDFNRSPKFYTDFDLFISASKYTKGPGRRSETFGMSTLEAIASGLPVIVTNAGGSPEIVGDEGAFSRIVPHSDGRAIGKAIESCSKEMSCFSDNVNYAKTRLEQYSARKQMKYLSQAIDRVTKKKLRVGVFTSIVNGGAGKAASRVHKALMINGVQSVLLTRDNTATVPREPNCQLFAAEIGVTWETMQAAAHARPGYTIFSVNEPGLRRETLAKIVENMDVINLHWTARFLSAEDIGYLSNIGKKVVITVRDMHPLTGGCHFFHDCDQWRADCYGCPQLVGDKNHFPAKVLAIKKRYWNMDNISFVALSKHTARIIKKSALYQGNKISVIYNPIDLDAFTVTAKTEARAHFGIKDGEAYLFYIPSYGSLIKGAHKFRDALQYLKNKYPSFELKLIMAGSATSLVNEADYGFPVIHLGGFSDNKMLAKAYSSADATIIPSLEETFSNTAAESVSCGTPVVGFNTGAIPEIAGNGTRGISVPVGDSEALAEGIYEVLARRSANEKSAISERCRIFAENNFSFEAQGQKYAQVFEQLASLHGGSECRDPKAVPVIDGSIMEDVYWWQAKTAEMKQKELVRKIEELSFAAGKAESMNPAGNKARCSLNEDDEFKRSFAELCSVSVYRHPMLKLKRYKSLMSMLHKYRETNMRSMSGASEFVDDFDSLCSTRFIYNPLEKYKKYKNLINTWHKHKDNIEK